MLYATTDKFLRVFGFNSLDDLPQTEPLVDPTAVAEKPTDETAAAVKEETVEEGVDDEDVKIADGKIVVPDKVESPIDLSRSSTEMSAEETGGEVENSTGD
jgi:hypothetical protein